MPEDSRKRSDTGRGRAEGWRFAKTTGHEHEESVASRLRTDLMFADTLAVECFGEPLGLPKEITGGGASEARISDVFGGNTNGKPDLYVVWPSGHRVQVSLKKSSSGQAFLTSVDRFVDGFAKQFGRVVPNDVHQCLELFIGGDLIRIQTALRGRPVLGPIHRGTSRSLEEHQNRLVGATLQEYFPSQWNATIQWITDEIGNIADFVFARGYARESINFASHIWYLGIDSTTNRNHVFSVSEIVAGSTRSRAEVRVGERNGGSTIQLPFGFLQMHSPKGHNLMQFHHSFDKVDGLTSM